MFLARSTTNPACCAAFFRPAIWGIVVALGAAGALGEPAYAQTAGSMFCGDLKNAFGPFDYRRTDQATRHLVESHHFTAQVEALRAGQEGYIGSDLDYTLRAFPNSPRALLAVSRYGRKLNTDRPPAMTYSVDCYFDRATRLAPDDPMPHLIYAMHLKDRKHTGEVKAQLDQVEALRGDPSSFDLDYNLGLLYFDIGEIDKSAIAAKRAYELGAPLPALMSKLKKAGKWLE